MKSGYGMSLQIKNLLHLLGIRKVSLLWHFHRMVAPSQAGAQTQQHGCGMWLMANYVLSLENIPTVLRPSLSHQMVRPWKAVATVIRGIYLWDTENGTRRLTLNAHTTETSLAFSPDSQTLMAGGGDGNIRLWDVNTGELRTTIYEDDGSVQDVTFSPDGKTIASTKWARYLFMEREYWAAPYDALGAYGDLCYISVFGRWYNCCRTRA